MEKITKKDIVEDIAKVTPLYKRDIQMVVDETIIRILNGLKEGKTVELSGLGKFEVTERAARQGINPLTKEKINIDAKKVVRFKSSKSLKDAVNNK